MSPIFITGIGTDVGKTIVSAVLTQALGADYWKPVQAGIADGTDALTITSLVTHPATVIHPAAYQLNLPASPHIAARRDHTRIEMDKIIEAYKTIDRGSPDKPLIIEGAGDCWYH